MKLIENKKGIYEIRTKCDNKKIGEVINGELQVMCLNNKCPEKINGVKRIAKISIKKLIRKEL